MAAPAHVQDTSTTFSGVSSVDLSLSSDPTAGNTVAAVVLCSTANRTWTISDDQSDTWTSHESNTDSAKEVLIASAVDVTGGFTTYTATINISTGNGHFVLVEIGDSDFDTSGQFSRASNGTTHYCAATTEIDTGADTYVLAAGVTNASPGTVTANASYTEVYNSTGSTANLVQYRTSDSALTDERADWTTSTGRHCNGVIASWTAPAGGGGDGTDIQMTHFPQPSRTKPIPVPY